MARIEDLYDVQPIEIELTGGYFDGRRMHVPDQRDTFLLPLPAPIDLSGPPPDVTSAPMDAEVYRYTGTIRDDGTRVYQFAFRS